MLTLLVATILAFPPPAWLERNPMPLPRVEAVQAVPQVKLIKRPTPPVLERLPGPRNLFRCPHCGASDCLMFLGQTLRTRHKVSDAYLDKLGPRQWGVLYDNIINSRGPAVTVRSGCENGQCPTPRRVFTGLGSRLRKR